MREVAGRGEAVGEPSQDSRQARYRPKECFKFAETQDGAGGMVAFWALEGKRAKSSVGKKTMRSTELGGERKNAFRNVWLQSTIRLTRKKERACVVLIPYQICIYIAGMSE